MINEQIRDKEVRLIGAEGEQLGVLPLSSAMQIAEEKHLDLVKIAPGSKPPVCKIMDYSKYKFEQAKKNREVRKRSKTVDTKELWLSPNIDTHDIDVQVKKAIKFLKNGDKVKVTIRFRYGREIGRTDVAHSILKEFASKVEEYGTIDRAAKMEGRRMSMFIVAKKESKEKNQENE
jgi:translation initiation factor IF-3